MKETNYGAVDFKGVTYTLTDDAVCTNRVLNNGTNDTHFEMSAPATTENGAEYMVYWIFETQEDAELDAYDYDDVDRVEEI